MQFAFQLGYATILTWSHRYVYSEFRLFFEFDSIKPFSQQPYGSSKPATAVSGDIDTGPPAQAAWEGRSIATHKFRLLEFSAYMEVQREETVIRLEFLWNIDANCHSFIFVNSSNFQYRHLFVHIGGKTSYSDPLLEVKHWVTELQPGDPN